MTTLLLAHAYHVHQASGWGDLILRWALRSFVWHSVGELFRVAPWLAVIGLAVIAVMAVRRWRVAR